MSTYVLIHGAWHGAWCWEKIVPILEKNGHEVFAIDLPSHGADPTPVSTVSLKSYTDRVCEVLDKMNEPVILVGHSMGGIVISQTAEYRPEKIKSLVYVTAFLLQNKESMVDIIQTDTEAIVHRNMIISEDGTYATINPDELKNIFYGQCQEEDVERAKSLLTPQALGVISTRLTLSDERYGQIPHYYIECLRDRAITHSCQKNMYTKSPCKKVFTLDTDHSPFFSTPQALASILLSIQ
ncbi:alpha/beta fold hydrolase [Bacillaceae bacterium]